MVKWNNFFLSLSLCGKDRCLCLIYYVIPLSIECFGNLNIKSDSMHPVYTHNNFQPIFRFHFIDDKKFKFILKSANHRSAVSLSTVCYTIEDRKSNCHSKYFRILFAYLLKVFY